MISSPAESDAAHQQFLKNLKALAATYLFAPMRTEPAKTVEADGWNQRIARMVDVGYAFDSTVFQAAEFDTAEFDLRPCLFRGQATGFTFDAANPERALNLIATATASERDSHLFERTFGVQFVSHEISDALTASGRFDPASSQDNAIIVIDASFYNEANADGDAASMAVGDAGHVFSYPFITRSITLNHIILLFVGVSLARKLTTKLPALKEKIVTVDLHSQSETEQRISAELTRRGLCAARAGSGGRRPNRDDLFAVPVCTIDDVDECASSRVCGQ